MNPNPISDVMQLIPALQSARKFWLEPKTPSLAERQAWVEKLAVAWEQNLDGLTVDETAALALEAGLSPETYADWDLRGSLLFLKHRLTEIQQLWQAPMQSVSSSVDHLARGVLVLMQSRLHPLRLMVERLVPGLLSGNSLILKFSSETPRAALFMLNTLTKAGLPEAVIRVVSVKTDDLDQILSTHPAISGLSVVDSPVRVEELFRQSFSLKRVFQAWTGGRTSLLMLEPITDEKWRVLLHAFLDGSRQLRPYDVTRVFVLESQEEESRLTLERIVGGADWITGYTEAEGRAYEAMVTRLKEEEGRLIAGGEVVFDSGEAKLKPALVLHLPQCSEYHQEDPVFPILLLGSVKYGFDTAKWVNNASRGFAVQIYGPAEKIEKLAGKFEVGQVLGPNGYDPSENLLFGLKESAVGVTDLRPDGLFFSQERRS